MCGILFKTVRYCGRVASIFQRDTAENLAAIGAFYGSSDFRADRNFEAERGGAVWCLLTGSFRQESTCERIVKTRLGYFCSECRGNESSQGEGRFSSC